jgi:hypothetical protein
MEDYWAVHIKKNETEGICQVLGGEKCIQYLAKKYGTRELDRPGRRRRIILK